MLMHSATVRKTVPLLLVLYHKQGRKVCSIWIAQDLDKLQESVLFSRKVSWSCHVRQRQTAPFPVSIGMHSNGQEVRLKQ